MTLLDKLLTENMSIRKWRVVGLNILIALPLILLGIYGIEEYGLALFILTPLLIGYTSAVWYGHKRYIPTKSAVKISMLSLGLLSILLLLFAIEGLICIVMAAPIVLLFAWLGAVIGFATQKQSSSSKAQAILIMIAAIPTTAFVEKQFPPPLLSVTTQITIEADIQTVWDQVIAFPEMKEPTELLFKAGIAYPTSAQIEGTGVGAVRHCNFTTGSFVEPITTWEEPTLLQFDVEQQPAPMQELSFWDIDAPHLHDYFVSQKGQFELKALPDGGTLVVGTTWYKHHIKPSFYWRWWSDMIIHKIHERVLKHIKQNAEETN